jgi:hypothetical protein
MLQASSPLKDRPAAIQKLAWKSLPMRNDHLHKMLLKSGADECCGIMHMTSILFVQCAEDFEAMRNNSKKFRGGIASHRCR